MVWTANLDSFSMSFMLDIEDKIKDRIWFEKQATSSTVAVEVPGINCLAMYAPHAQSGNLRVECQGIQASFDASIIRLLVSMHRSWIVSGSEKRKWKVSKAKLLASTNNTAKYSGYRNNQTQRSNSEEDGDGFQRSDYESEYSDESDDSQNAQNMFEYDGREDDYMINHDVDDRHFAVDVVLFVETGKCIVWDHGRTKELFSVDLPEVHAKVL